MSIFDDLAVIAHASGIVINRRMQVLSEGGLAAYNEMLLIFAEKAELFAFSSLSLASGRSLIGVVKFYREVVEANIRRFDVSRRRAVSRQIEQRRQATQAK
jgi:hypothetical protein